MHMARREPGPIMVSCICPTYNRAATRKELLEEAVESFLRQTYPHRELIVMNDHPDQVVVFDHPLVRVVNHPARFATLGEKYNAAIETATGSIICPWEDDDISLPNRLTDSVVMLRRFDYWNPLGYWFADSDGLHKDHPIGVSHNASAFTKEAWRKVGGYSKVSGPQDAQMDSLLRASLGARSWSGRLADPRSWNYIYRWGVSDLHLSAFKDTQKTYDEYAASSTLGGRFELEPHWRIDYAAEVKRIGGSA